MNTSNMKNMIVIKDLPSNIVEEAIIILKANQKIKKNIHVPKENKEKTEVVDKKDDYIIKEAEMIISKYISDMEDKNNNKSKDKILMKKYKTLKYIACALSIACWIQLVLLIY